MQPAVRRVRGHHDLELHVLEWSTRGEPLLLLHGFGHSARVWDAFVPELARRWRVLALDQRGHGDSAHDPAFRYHHGSIARDVEAVLDALEIRRAALVAHSMGGYAAIRFAARRPERVSRLVLIDAGPELSAASRAGRGEERDPATPSYASEADYAAALARAYPRADPRRLAELAPHWLRRRDDGRFALRLDPAFVRPKSARDPAARRRFDRRRWAREEEARLWKMLAAIPCPVLVVRGEHSPMLSAATVERMLGEALPAARAATIPGAGHAVMLDAPDALRRALGDFLLD